jgi:hypothetical protein
VAVAAQKARVISRRRIVVSSWRQMVAIKYAGQAALANAPDPCVNRRRPGALLRYDTPYFSTWGLTPLAAAAYPQGV